ncbi:MFS transporter [Qingshengfaniella alkalisoli]|uniref:Na+/melibiose symporter-like transporter n=1 Tax=Qingshengfaniella alkalisoli TaxID=2599296 RepID=A0A5B8J149_9RHOB|nr:MFS transporter [Qingshengfaniella alkalisoli]QDY70598.1 hypothetical protein FPZ52_12955 [Qingshengfaniella alkalisoli]
MTAVFARARLDAGLIAGLLAFAGLPLYVHLPQYATRDLGLSLSMVGVILLAVRIVDFAQDATFGWAIDKYKGHRTLFGVGASLALAMSFLAVFSLPFPTFKAVWLSVWLILLFSAFSLLNIAFYAQGVAWGAREGTQGHYRLAGTREAGTLIGIVIAAAAPGLLQLANVSDTYRAFGWLVAVTGATVGVVTIRFWSAAPQPTSVGSWQGVFRRETILLLALAMINTLPVALTSTLFLFFVEQRLGRPELAGPFLALFFLAAGTSAPVWSRLTAGYSLRSVLLAGMLLSIAAFGWAFRLGTGDTLAFALICVVSGIGLGADLVLLPALFSSTLSALRLPTGFGFGLWSLVNKLALALAASAALPALELAGFEPQGPNDPLGLNTLAFFYAALPCLLKLIAVAFVLINPSSILPTRKPSPTPA